MAEEKKIEIGKLYYHYYYGELVVSSVEENYVHFVPSEDNEFFRKALKVDELVFSSANVDTGKSTGKGCVLFLTPEEAVKPFADAPESNYYGINGSQGQSPKALGTPAFDDFDDLYVNASDSGKKKLLKFGKDANQKDASQIPLLYHVIPLDKLKVLIDACKSLKTDEKNPYYYGEKYLPKKKQDVKRVWIEDKISLNPIYYCPVFENEKGTKSSLLEFRAEQLKAKGELEKANAVEDILKKIKNFAEQF